MQITQCKTLILAAFLGCGSWSALAATYKEQAGRVVVEAEHFDKRTTNSTDTHLWAIIPDESGKPFTPADTGFANARGGKYMQSLPDVAAGGTNHNTVALVGADPYLEYKVLISNTGVYRLWMRWGGYDGSSDSIYAQIMELKTPTGPGPDWYRYVGNINLDFDAGWNGSGAPSTDAANRVGGGGGEVPAVYNITTPGTYTIRISMREDGSSVDTVMLQFASLPAPGNPGPPESDTTTSVDTTPPTVTDAVTDGNPNGLLVEFSEAVSPSTATNKSNYAINNGVVVNGASMGPNNYSVWLSTTDITPGKTYQLTVNGVQDTATTPNTIAANTQVPFFQADGVIQRRVFLQIGGGTAISDLTNSVKFIKDQPDIVDYLALFEAPTDWADQYGTQIRGYLTAPTTGNYVFFICSDDLSTLFLSTDENPANKHPIATETAWSNSRQWVASAGNSDLPSKRSDSYTGTGWPNGNTITLTAGKRYYIEALHKEGGGGDNLAVTWSLPGAGDPADGDSPIPGRYLSAFATPAVVSIATQPTNLTVLEPGSATFTVGPSGSPPYIYQWFKNGVAIPGATSQSYTQPISLKADNGAKFKVQVSDAFSSATSSDATLSVTPDTTPPKPGIVTSVDPTFKIVTLTFNEMMDKASTETGANYVFSPGNVAGASAVLDASATSVTITTASALTPGTNTITLNGVKDLAGNPVVPNTVVKFIFNPVTYAADIEADGPIGYFRFEETSGSVATNSGTSGVDGAYYTGDESSPGSGGSPSSPKGDPGPRPPTFAGFDANNRSATFGGANSQDWVDTQKQYLNGLGAFSLEYWVRPTNRVADPTAFGTRIGIVGQNDAIEYGFIDANTIQIWTPNGGSINTTYSFPDNEWHHVATIASGTNIKTYYDGALVTTGGTATGNYGTSAYNVHIGGGGVFDAAGNYFTGNIDEVAIFDKAIPAERIAAHFQAGKSGGVLVVNPDVTPPQPLQITEVNSTYKVVTLTFNERMDKASTETAQNYVFSPGNIAAASVSLATNGTRATITTASALTPSVVNILTLNGVKDLAGNTIDANTKIAFKFEPVNYTANVLSEGPLAYYRFEETSGSVATNSGSTSGNGAYYTGDETSPGAGGTPSSAKGDPGPQPPAFAGFPANNHSATFGGTATSDWVDTKNQFLNAVGAFSLEYWVKPTIRVSDPTTFGTRIGIVGQNDAVEYGFIDANNILVFTANGGSLTTPYSFPDNEWHHVATTADGTFLKTYFDGVLLSTGGTAVIDYGSSTFNVHIGGGGVFDATGNYFTGNIDEVAIFNKALTADQVAAHYQAGKDGVVTTTVPIPVATGPQLSLSKSGTTLTISWTPTGGTLQTAPSLGGTPNWSDVGTTNPATITIGASNAFYRVKGP